MTNWRFAATSAVLAVSFAASMGCSTKQSDPEPQSPPPPGVVIVRDMKFTPEVITIKAGETVTWQFADSVPHTATGDGAAVAVIDSPLYKGGEYQVTFTAPGEFSYHCSPHPSMTGKVVVE